MKRSGLKKIFELISNELRYSFVSSDILKRNASFKDKYKSKRCFIIGNGPSLKTQDLSLLKDEITFAMSGFWKHPIIESWQPTYYCFADPVFFDGSKQMSDFFNILNGKVNKTIFFVPLFAKDKVERFELLPGAKTNYVKFDHFLNKIKNRIELTGSIFPSQSVSQLAIQAAIYMGCNPIYLLGLDHDWLAHKGMDTHFYPDKTVENHAIAHGDLNKWSYRESMEAMLKLWKIYEKLLVIAKMRKIEIINLTGGGFLDVYKESSYEDLFSRKLT